MVRVAINDHFLKTTMFPLLSTPDMRRTSDIISERNRNRNPYSINAIQNPPIIFRISDKTEE
jgi:hypothetical protein